MIASVTALYAGLLALLLVALSARVTLLRRKYQVGIGDNGQRELALAIRVQGNAVEYIPLAVLLLLLAELNGFPAWCLHIAGSGFFLGRILHAAGLGRHSGYSPGRFIGTALTWTLLLALGAALIADAIV